MDTTIIQHQQTQQQSIDSSESSDPVLPPVVAPAGWVQVGDYIYIKGGLYVPTRLDPPEGATGIWLQPDKRHIYITLNGTTPSAENGLLVKYTQDMKWFPLQPGQPVWILQEDSAAIVRGVWTK